jgi:mannose/fructose/N-acetylgalactosamine-specific phosphotransferase system component IID
MDVALSTRLKPADTLAGVTTVAALTAITNALPTGANVLGAIVPATLVVTAVSAANTTVTATLPAVAAQFHYISRIVIERVATTAVVGSAVLTYTSTNLPGSWARTSGNAAPVGQQMKDVDDTIAPELRSSAVNTNTTIIAPAAGATAVVRITVYYRAAT